MVAIQNVAFSDDCVNDRLRTSSEASSGCGSNFRGTTFAASMSHAESVAESVRTCHVSTAVATPLSSSDAERGPSKCLAAVIAIDPVGSRLRYGNWRGRLILEFIMKLFLQ